MLPDETKLRAGLGRGLVFASSSLDLPVLPPTINGNGKGDNYLFCKYNESLALISSFLEYEDCVYTKGDFRQELNS